MSLHPPLSTCLPEFKHVFSIPVLAQHLLQITYKIKYIEFESIYERLFNKYSNELIIMKC